MPTFPARKGFAPGTGGYVGLQRCQVATHGGPGQLTNTLTLTSRARYACAARARAIGRAVGLPSDVADVDTAL